jgi:thiol-disulfide isomerase/thioredoxin
LINGPWKDKFIFVDFYMEHCPWCYYILDEFNQLIDEFTDMYGADKVEFVKIDGPKNSKLANLFAVKGYPSFQAVAPSSKGKPYSVFTYSPRNYDTLKTWMFEVLGNTPMREEETVEPCYEPEPYTQTVPNPPPKALP